MKYIDVDEKLLNKLSKERLLNIFKINRKYLFQVLADCGFDTSNGGININHAIADDELYFNKEYNKISFLNDQIKKILNE